MRLRRKTPLLSNSPRQRRLGEGKVGAPKFAYRARRSDVDLNLGRQAQREALKAAPGKLRRFMLQRFGLVVLLLVVLICVVNALSLSTNPRVLPLTSGTDIGLLHQTAIYQQAASQLLGSSVWNRNKLTVNISQINRAMLDRFPELSHVSVTLPLLSQRPIVYVQTARPALILVTRDGSFVISDSGKALLSTSSLAPDTDLRVPLITDQSGLTVSLNHQALSSDDMRFVQTLIGQLSARHFSVSSMLLPNATSELDVRLAGQPYAVKFNLQSGEARQQVGTFLATQAKLQSQNIIPAQYIDVRVEGRAYYQ